MNIKDLLLKGISSAKPIIGCQRFYCGNWCFSIHFELRGKFLRVTRIKKRRSHGRVIQKQQRRIKTPQRLIRSQRENFLKDCDPEESNLKKSLEQFIFNSGDQIRKIYLERSPTEAMFTGKRTEKIDQEVQTIEMASKKSKLKSSLTQTECATLQSAGNQILKPSPCPRSAKLSIDSINVLPSAAKSWLSTSCQTENNSHSVTTQCIYFSDSKYSQTKGLMMTSIGLQVENDIRGSGQFEWDTKQNFDDGALIFMLNEIGELVVNQNRLLTDNVTRLNQIYHLTNLPKSEISKGIGRIRFKWGSTKKRPKCCMIM
ncbi:uncharacterized protein LOC142229640 isoform X2 [Haematobia irritans]|uniref:uncharacterized protein LOC142229640 isoform X2 n=1 Tax=Haematobia irritans TaxID=7368 RepID=UPI003F504345